MKLQVFGFAIIVAVAIAGVDYSMQARKSEQSLGAARYVDSITDRFHAAAEARALKARQKQEVKIHLPEAPEGWVRREWAEADTTRIEVVTQDMSGWDKRGMSAMELSPMMAGMIVADVQLSGKMRRKQIWVYERGDEIIALRVLYTKTGAAKRFPGLDGNIEAANVDAVKTAVPYALVQGVVFGEVRPVLAGAGPSGYRGFSTSLGSNVMIGVRAIASDTSVLTLMGQIDFDGLNGMLDQPLDGIGKNAPDLAPDQQLAMAEQAMNAHRVMLFGEPLDVVAEEDTAVGLVEDASVEVALPKTPEIEFDAVRAMPGQKCVRKSGSLFCSGFTN